MPDEGKSKKEEPVKDAKPEEKKKPEVEYEPVGPPVKVFVNANYLCPGCGHGLAETVGKEKSLICRVTGCKYKGIAFYMPMVTLEEVPVRKSQVGNEII